MENSLERCIDIRVEIATLEREKEPEEGRDLSEVHPKARDKKRQQYFRALRHNREKGRFRGKQKALVGVPRRKGGFARKLATSVARH